MRIHWEKRMHHRHREKSPLLKLFDRKSNWCNAGWPRNFAVSYSKRRLHSSVTIRLRKRSVNVCMHLHACIRTLAACCRRWHPIVSSSVRIGIHVGMWNERRTTNGKSYTQYQLYETPTTSFIAFPAKHRNPCLQNPYYIMYIHTYNVVHMYTVAIRELSVVYAFWYIIHINVFINVTIQSSYDIDDTGGFYRIVKCYFPRGENSRVTKKRYVSITTMNNKRLRLSKY